MFGGGVSCPCALLGNRNSAVNMMGGGMQAIHMVDSNVQDTSTDYRIGGRRGGDEAKKVKRDQDEEFNFSGHEKFNRRSIRFEKKIRLKKQKKGRMEKSH